MVAEATRVDPVDPEDVVDATVWLGDAVVEVGEIAVCFLRMYLANPSQSRNP